jgi:very-short-patch-repair endonuclease
VRELRKTSDVLAKETKSRVQWALKTGRWTQIIQGVLGRGPKPPSKLDIARATALVTDGVCHGLVAGQLFQYDNVKADGPEVWVPRSCRSERDGIKRKLHMPTDIVTVHQVKCTTPADTLLELADRLDDIGFEQALEFGLRKQHVTRELLATWTHPRVKRVIRLRGGLGVPHTDSLLETLAIQLIREDPLLPTPTRQLPIWDQVTQRYIAKVDLCWPELRIFVELDGQQHKDQPVYDAWRQNKVSAITGWICIRLTWDQVNEWPNATLRDLRELLVPNSLVS